MGVTFDNEKQMFVFDFEHDGAEDIVNLTGDGYQVRAFGKCSQIMTTIVLRVMARVSASRSQGSPLR